MQIIWNGTASIKIISKQGQILFDPFVPFEGIENKVEIDQYDGFKNIFVTHGHFDHILNIPEIVKRNESTTVYCTKTPYNTLLNKGVSETNLKLIEYNQTHKVDDIEIKIYHGKHAILPGLSFKRVFYILKSKYKRNLLKIAKVNKEYLENDESLFYQITCEGKTISLIGSLNLRDDIDYPVESDVLILPYNGWDDNYKKAVEVIEKLKPKKVLLDHYDDAFPPITMPLDLKSIIEKYDGVVEQMKYDDIYEL